MLRRVVAVLAAVALVTGVAGCSSSAPAPALRLLGPDDPGASAGAAIPGVARDTPYSFLTFQLCATRGSVMPTSVTLNRPTGKLSLVDWGVTAQPSQMGAMSGTVATVYPGSTHGPISYPCTGAGPGATLYVSVRSPEAVGSDDGLTVAWKHGTVRVPFTTIICTAKCPEHSG